MILSDLGANKNISKKREFNDYSLITNLVKKYKETNSQDDLLEILKNLEGIVNTYTLICTPSDSRQSIHITPYMCKFLGMFLTKDERIQTTYPTYIQACQRIRWILRHYSYEDMYSRLLEILIEIIRKMKVVGDCDCIYFIQKMTQYKMYDLIMKASKDASTHTCESDLPGEQGSSNEDFRWNRHNIDGNSINDEDWFYTPESLYTNISINALVENFDFYKLLSQYEKYLLYLSYGLFLTNKQIVLLVRHRREKQVVADLKLLYKKILDASQEYLTV